MSVTISEAVRELLAGRARLTRADGAVVDVVPDPPAGDTTPLQYGEGVMLDAPYFDLPPNPAAYRVTAVWGKLSPPDPVVVPPDDGGDKPG